MKKGKGREEKEEQASGDPRGKKKLGSTPNRRIKEREKKEIKRRSQGESPRKSCTRN